MSGARLCQTPVKPRDEGGFSEWNTYHPPVISAADKRELRRELEAAGCFERQELAAWAQLIALLGLAGVVLSGVAAWGPWAALGLVPLSALIATSAVMIGHEGGHRSLSTSPFRNSLMLHICFPLIGGLGALYWQWKHNAAHHGQPNVPGADPDIQLWPMASHRGEWERSGPFRRWLQEKHQGWLFWPLTTFLPWSMRVSSIAHLMSHIRKRGFDRAARADAAAQLGHYLGWVVLPSLFFDFWSVVGVYLAYWAIMGLGLSAVFAPAHMGLPLYESADCGWSLQLATTRNLRLPRWLAWTFVGLDHQVEHHLFPKMPHRHMPKASAIISAWAERVGVPYQEIDYVDGLMDVTRFMGEAWTWEVQHLDTSGGVTLEAA